jgi:hypothetical protein
VSLLGALTIRVADLTHQLGDADDQYPGDISRFRQVGADQYELVTR